MSSKDTGEEREMQSKSVNIEIMNHDRADEVMEELSKSHFNRYHIVLETSMRGSDFVFNCVNLLHYIYYKISFKRDRSYSFFIFSEHKTNLRLIRKYVKIKILVILQCLPKTLRY